MLLSHSGIWSKQSASNFVIIFAIQLLLLQFSHYFCNLVIIFAFQKFCISRSPQNFLFHGKYTHFLKTNFIRACKFKSRSNTVFNFFSTIVNNRIKKIKARKKHFILKVEILRLLVEIFGFQGSSGNDTLQKYWGILTKNFLRAQQMLAPLSGWQVQTNLLKRKVCDENHFSR